MKFWLTRDPTAIVGGAYAAIGNGSYVEANKTATSVDITKMRSFMTKKVEANASEEIDNPDHDTVEFYLIHGDYLVITGTDGGAAIVSAIIEWGEEI
jgi:hypothetical protein